MDEKNYEGLKLENQLCFPLYAAAKEVVRKYRPLLDSLDLTYTQYIAMLLLWEHKQMHVKELGARLYLDSGTLTPLLKNLERKGYITRKRNGDDERVLNVTVTQAGEALKESALHVPQAAASCVSLTPEEAVTLYKLLYKILASE